MWWLGHWVGWCCPLAHSYCTYDVAGRGWAGPALGFLHEHLGLLFTHQPFLVILISASGTWDGHNPSQEWCEVAYLKMFFKLWSPVYGLFCFVFYVLIFITRANSWSSMPCWVNCINPESQMGARKVNWPLILFYFIWFASLRFKKFRTFRPLQRMCSSVWVSCQPPPVSALCMTCCNPEGTGIWVPRCTSIDLLRGRTVHSYTPHRLPASIPWFNRLKSAS